MTDLVLLLHISINAPKQHLDRVTPVLLMRHHCFFLFFFQMDACLIPALLVSSAPVSLMVPGSAENAQLATVVMESRVKTLMRYDGDPS